MKAKAIASLLILVTIILTVSIYSRYFGGAELEMTLDSSPSNIIIDDYTASPSETIDTKISPKVEGREILSTNTIYFGKGENGKYSLVDTRSGKAKPFFPSGYTILNQHEYQQFPPYLILQKNSDIFAYDVERDIPINVFEFFSDLKLQEDEKLRIYPSITEKGKFFFAISKHDPEYDPSIDMGRRAPISIRSYTFDAYTSKLASTSNVNFEGCVEYDSKNQRFFTWPCGEGIGYIGPLSVSDMTGKKQFEAITLEDFGLAKESTESFGLKYQNGLFIAYDTRTADKIITIDSQSNSLKKEVYSISSIIKPEISEVYPYSIAISEDTNTIIIGGNNYILLLRFDDNRQIVKSSYIHDRGIYANFIFSYNGKLYYQANDTIRIIDLTTWQIEKSIPSKLSDEITLFSLHD